jgi:hypothetical protein
MPKKCWPKPPKTLKAGLGEGVSQLRNRFLSSFPKNQIISTLGGQSSKTTGRKTHLMQPVVKKYNASDDGKRFCL